MNKHAYLILAHNEPEIFKVLVSLLDDERNDIFVHVDKKANINNFKIFDKLQYSKIIFINDRVDVRWCDITMIQAEFALFKTSQQYAKENYGTGYLYYHLLSGVDLPIKKQNYIHNFFEKNKGKEFVSFLDSEERKKILNWRMNYYWFFTRQFRNKNIIIRKTYSFFRLFFYFLQKLFHINRSKYQKFTLAYGSQWVSITDKLVNQIIAMEKELLLRYKKTIVPDESVVQTVLKNSSLYQNLFEGLQKDNLNTSNFNLREIDFNRGNPWIWKESDFDFLKESSCLFARKFSSSDMGIVNKIIKISSSEN